MSNIPTLSGLDAAQVGHITNGCGGTGFDVPDWIFFRPCQQHDLDYWIGCDDKDRYTADYAFYCGMKTEAAKLPWYKRWFYYGLAYTYYRSVRLFTKKYFYYGPTKRTLDDLQKEMNPQLPAGPISIPDDLCTPGSDAQVVS